ncbi:MAG: 5-bromo-4-chloroindolyl phosphate hydrolysis family protein [Clostridia bacterium]|nr:5-bromo-4-chloroindolyl phosphate hydrolysis family protein [Clostridia bacterium]
MSNYNHLHDFFQQLERTVQDISGQSSSELKRNINNTVRDVVNTAVHAVESISDAVTTAVQNGTSSAQQQYPPQTGTNGPVGAPYSSPSSSPVPKTTLRKAKPQMIDKALAIRPKKVPGRISGTFLTIAGLSGGIVCGLGALGALGSSAILGALLATGVFVALAGRGFFLTGRADRYARYYNEMRTVTFCPVSELAEKVGKSPKYVARDLKNMIRLNFFKEGHLDAEEKTFMLDHATYEHYVQSRNRLEAERAEKEKYAANPELEATIEEGMLCIRKIREANDAIPGEVISAKLDRLERVITRIFEFMKKYPERLGEIRRFTSYYLPTTLKLVAAYREFDAQEVQGETVLESKREIESALDTINQSFEATYDKLFEQSARDLSADISVLQTMLRQDGYEKDEITGAKPD